MSRQMPGPDRGRPARVDEAAFGGRDRDRPKGTIVVGCGWIEDAFDRVGAVRASKVHGGIDRPVHLRRGAGEIHRQIVALNANLAADCEWFFEAVHCDPVSIHAIGRRLDSSPHGCFRAVQDLFDQRIEVLDLLVFKYFQESGLTHVVGRELGPDVSQRFLRRAQILANEGNDILVFHPFADDLANRDGQAFFMRIAGGDGWRATDVHGMKYAADKADQLPAPEDRANHGDVVQVAGAVVAIVGYQHIPGFE